MAGKRKDHATRQPMVIRTEEETRRVFQFRMAIVKGVTIVFSILAGALPLYMVRLMMQDIAGKTTTVSLGITLTAAVTGAAGLWKIIAGRVKMNRQGKELTRGRTRIETLEAEIRGLKHGKKETHT